MNDLTVQQRIKEACKNNTGINNETNDSIKPVIRAKGDLQ